MEFMRRKLIAANWKENKTNKDVLDFIEKLKAKELKDRDVLILPSFVSLVLARNSIGGTSIMLGAQDVSENESGAFSGEVSAEMLRDSCDYVMIGHSERRKYHKETDAQVNKKIDKAISAGLKPILCVGETHEQRKDGLTNDVILKMLVEGLNGFTEDELLDMVVAYEPVWAISGGDASHERASTEDAVLAHRFIRGQLKTMFSEEFAEKTRIIYGGSVKPTNAKELLDAEGVDGALVGGASLDVESFAGIINY